MCKEFLSIAICAPKKGTPDDFYVWEAASRGREKGAGVSSSEGTPLSLVKSIRCVTCTSREEEVGDRRSKEELVDSPLLTRATIQSPAEMEEFKSIINTLWGGKDQCPFHTLSAIREENAEASDEHASNKDVSSASTSPILNPTKEMPDDNISDGSGNSSKSPTKGKHDNGLGRKVGIEASIWAEAKQESPERKHQSPPRVQSPHQRQQSMNRRGGKTAKIVLPQIAAAKSFLGEAKDWE
ncbi:benzoate 4-monooxygenase [Trichoderma arundinaceum]|uniref:Benzoate 4-monooxygenase n=1 Tax=Trichoderma arundinaceum TaxID=490622 RepID=A0A395N8W4_TRIAR|nr:benzoate 4-monooxygenase [Trichoderma arundinaceum]